MKAPIEVRVDVCVASVRLFRSVSASAEGRRRLTSLEGKGLIGKGRSRWRAGQEAKRIAAALLATIDICGHGPDPIRQDAVRTKGERGDQKYRQ